MVSREKLDKFYEENIKIYEPTLEEFQIWRKVERNNTKTDIYFVLEDEAFINKYSDDDIEYIVKHIDEICEQVEEKVSEYGFSSELIRDCIEDFLN